jgi:hypothetical protein
MLTSSQLDELSRVDIDAMDIRDLADIGTVSIDSKLPLNQRMEQYLDYIKNPYCFRSGDIKVKIAFAPDGKSLDDALENFFIGLKNC